jgi:hypothetical protein
MKPNEEWIENSLHPRIQNAQKRCLKPYAEEKMSLGKILPVIVNLVALKITFARLFEGKWESFFQFFGVQIIGSFVLHDLS